MALKLQGIQKTYPNGFRAVIDCNLEVSDGEFFTLLGPSGCGKTTTLRMIAGLETPSAGQILLHDRDLTPMHPGARDVAMVFQSYALYPHMTVRQNLVLNLEVRRVPSAEIEERLAGVSRMLAIEPFLDHKPKQLSGGQRQRVALGRALIRRPSIFLMDEPLSNLDLKLRERTRTELKKLHERIPVTTVYVTHDQAEALVLSDRIGIMDGGRLVQVGTPQEVYDRPSNTFVAKFVGTPSINLIAVSAEVDAQFLKLRLDDGGQTLDGLTLRAAPEILNRVQERVGRVVLGVRPEATALLSEPSPGAIATSIEVVEPMGSVHHIVLQFNDRSAGDTIDGDPFVALVPSTEVFVTGAKVWLRIRPDRLVLFDATSGNTLAVMSGARSWELP